MNSMNRSIVFKFFDFTSKRLDLQIIFMKSGSDWRISNGVCLPSYLGSIVSNQTVQVKMD